MNKRICIPIALSGLALFGLTACQNATHDFSVPGVHTVIESSHVSEPTIVAEDALEITIEEAVLELTLDETITESLQTTIDVESLEINVEDLAATTVIESSYDFEPTIVAEDALEITIEEAVLELTSDETITESLQTTVDVEPLEINEDDLEETTVEKP